MTQKYDIVHHNGEMCMVDDKFPIGDKYMSFSERGDKVVGGTIKTFQRLKGNPNEAYHVNESWNANWYYPQVPMGVFHILAATDKSLGLPLLPAVGEDLNSLSRLAFSNYKKLHGEFHDHFIVGFEECYKANTKKYTEEDMKKAFNEGGYYGGKSDTTRNNIFDELLQSLNPKPKQVEVYTESHNIGGGFGLAHFQPLQTTIKPMVVNGFVQVKRWIL